MTSRPLPADPRWFRAGLVVLAAAIVALGIVVWKTAPPPRRDAAPPAIAAPSDGRIHLSAGHELIIAGPGGEQRQVTSLLVTPAPMRFGDYVWNEGGVPSGKPWVRVDLDRQIVSVFRSEQEIGTAVILYGAQEFPTPLGWHQVIAKARDHYSRTYDAPMPYMLRLTADGVALHASEVREGRATHGCIGLPDGFAARLFEALQVGDPVVILGHPEKHG